MQLLPNLDNNRPLAVGLALVALIVVYLVGFHWFVARHLALDAEIDQLRDQAARFKAVAAQRAQIEDYLARLEDERLGSAMFLAQSDFSAAAAALNRRLRADIEEHAEDPELCSIRSVSNQRDTDPERFERVTVNVRMNCPLPDLVRVFHALEDAVPLVFLDNVVINQRTGANSRARGRGSYGQIDTSFHMYGFLSAPVSDSE